MQSVISETILGNTVCSKQILCCFWWLDMIWKPPTMIDWRTIHIYSLASPLPSFRILSHCSASVLTILHPERLTYPISNNGIWLIYQSIKFDFLFRPANKSSSIQNNWSKLFGVKVHPKIDKKQLTKVSVAVLFSNSKWEEQQENNEYHHRKWNFVVGCVMSILCEAIRVKAICYFDIDFLSGCIQAHDSWNLFKCSGNMLNMFHCSL